MAFVWLKTIYGPEDHPSVSASELKYLQQGGALVDLDGARANTRSDVNTLACNPNAYLVKATATTDSKEMLLGLSASLGTAR